MSPRARVTASRPFTRLLAMKPPACRRAGQRLRNFVAPSLKGLLLCFRLTTMLGLERHAGHFRRRDLSANAAAWTE